MATGDLRFYHSSGSPADEVIAAASGWAVHVDIELGDGSLVGELSSGLTRYAAPQGLPAGRVVVYPTAAHTTDTRLVCALNWAIGELSAAHGYGWLDIADAAAHAVDPDTAFLLAESGAWDCSDFATRFCEQAGIPLPDALVQEPHAVTPTQLATALGLVSG